MKWFPVLSLSTLIAISTAVTGLYAQTPLGTSFTYQGQLKNAGSPANGPLTIQFALFDTLTGGNQVGPTLNFDGITSPQVSVTNGLFTVQLDFGTTSFIGENRWLEVTVSGTALSPRQSLTAAPNALYAKNNWALNGNAGTDPANNYIGTPDNQPLALRVNNHRAMQYRYVDIGYFKGINVLGGADNNSIADEVVGGTISGGGDLINAEPNLVSANFGTIAGGINNTVSEYAATIGGGESNTVGGVTAVVAGGDNNWSMGDFASIGGGYGNEVTGFYSTIGGGNQNAVRNDWGAIGGGNSNIASGTWSTIGGGTGNIASDEASTVAGGYYNSAGDYSGAVGGGANNTAQGAYSTVSGGVSNFAGGDASVIPGGADNSTAGAYSFAAGFGAKANHFGAFVWADPSAGSFTSTANNQFLIRATGGVGIGTESPQCTLDVKGRTYVDPASFGGAPDISLAVGDTDTGLDSSGDGELDIYSNAVNSMSIRSGNVGIGTTAPTGRLTVAHDRQDGVSGPAFGIMFNSSLVGGFGHAAIYSEGSVGYNGSLVFATDGDGIQNYGATEKMRIRHDGNVGIGTSSPSQRLTVAGNICATGTIGACSDARFKEHVQPVTAALERVEHLRGVTFDWKRGEFKDHHFAEGRQMGFIAQEVEKVLPQVVSKGSDGYLSVDYGRLTPVLVEAMKEESSRVKTLEAENAALRADLTALAEKVDRLTEQRKEM